MDAVLAEYKVEAARWQMMQNAALGGMVLGAVGRLDGQLEWDAFGILVASGLAAERFAALRLAERKKRFEEDVLKLASQLERMMAGRHR